MRLDKLVTVLLVIIVSATGAVAAETIKVDPNTQGDISSTASHLLATSGRVKLEANNLTLASLLRDASKQAGIVMYPSDSPEDWQSRERTVTVFANNLSETGFRRGIAHLLEYQWLIKTYPDKRKEYILHETLAARLAREKWLSQTQAQYEKWRVECVDAARNDAATSQDMTEEEIQAARKADPWLYFLSTNPAGNQWAQVLQNMPTEWQNYIASGQAKYIRLEETPPAIRKSLETILGLPPTATSQTIDAGIRSLPMVRLQIDASNGEDDAVSGYANSSGFLCVYVKASDDNLLREVERLPIGPSKSTGCLWYGRMQTLLEDGLSREKAYQQGGTDSFSALKTRLEDMKPQPPDAPELMREITHRAVGDASESGLTKHLRGLARETGLSIMFETFDNAQTFCGAVPEKGTIRDILQAITHGSGLVWEKYGDVIFVRYPDWIKKRSLEVPSALLARWESHAKADVGLTYDTMLDIVSNTSHDQREQTLGRNEILRACGINKTLSGPIQISLVTLSQLSNDELKRQFMTTGLPVTKLRDLKYSGEQMDNYAASLKRYDDDVMIRVRVKALGKEDPRGQQAIDLCYFSEKNAKETVTTDYTVAFLTASKYLSSIEINPKKREHKTECEQQ